MNNTRRRQHPERLDELLQLARRMVAVLERETSGQIPRAELGRRLRDWRVRRELSQSQVALRLGCSPMAVCYWETERNLPSNDFVHRIIDLISEDPEIE